METDPEEHIAGAKESFLCPTGQKKSLTEREQLSYLECYAAVHDMDTGDY